MGLTNVAYAQRLTWGHPTLNRLEQQALGPIFAENPVEMGMRSHEADLTARLAALPLYVEKFAAAFPDQAEPITLDNALKAIASFERTLISANSRYDRFVAGDEAAMNASEKRGMELYFDDVTECFHCHGGFNFSDATDFAGSVSATPAFHNTGLYNLNGSGDYPTRNGGIFEITGNREQTGQFRAPTLRNIAESKPYMHDGSVPDLEGVIDHYAAGGRTIESGPTRGRATSIPTRMASFGVSPSRIRPRPTSSPSSKHSAMTVSSPTRPSLTPLLQRVRRIEGGIVVLTRGAVSVGLRRCGGGPLWARSGRPLCSSHATRYAR